MIRIERTNYNRFIECARQCRSNEVYPLSIAESVQSGDIFMDDSGKAALFWHYCGFAYLSGDLTAEFLDEIYKTFYCGETKKRFLLITEDANVVSCFDNKENVLLDRRAEYIYADPGNEDLTPADPGDKDLTLADRYTIERITEENICKIQGKIVPSFSWDSENRFLRNGFGYAAFDGNTFAGAAFSAAVSSCEVDIGVETAVLYRRQGIAKVLGDRMCREILRRGKRPVWAHAISNTGSMRNALSIGFKCRQINSVVKRLMK